MLTANKNAGDGGDFTDAGRAEDGDIATSMHDQEFLESITTQLDRP